MSIEIDRQDRNVLGTQHEMHEMNLLSIYLFEYLSLINIKINRQFFILGTLHRAILRPVIKSYII